MANSLLTKKNIKIEKSIEFGYYSAILHLSPANSSGYEVCPGRSAGCTNACNNGSGWGRFDSCQGARIKKTIKLFENRPEFISQLHKSINSHVVSCKNKGLKPAIRLNGTSDLPWWSRKYGCIIQAHPEVQFYDYTKVLGYLNPAKSKATKLDNYFQVFSRSENNMRSVKKAISWGYSVAVSFELNENKELPKSFMGLPVVNGDKHDLLFTHKNQCIVGLRFKHPRDKNIHHRMKMLKRDLSGFTVLYNEAEKCWYDPQNKAKVY